MNPTTRSNIFTLSAPSPYSLRDQRPGAGDPRIPAWSEDALAAVPVGVRMRRTEAAEAFAQQFGHQVIRRALRVGAHLDAPVHALAHTALRSNVYDAVAAVPAVAAGLRCITARVPVAHGVQLYELARILVVAASAASVGMHRDYHPGLSAVYAEAQASVATSLALHTRLDALVAGDAELAHVIHDAVTGDLFVCEYVRGGKTFAEYRTRRGGTLRVDSKSTHRFTRV